MHTEREEESNGREAGDSRMSCSHSIPKLGSGLQVGDSGELWGGLRVKAWVLSCNDLIFMFGPNVSIGSVQVNFRLAPREHCSLVWFQSLATES